MKILRKNEVKELLHLSDKQARALMRDPRFPAFRIGTQYMIDEAALQEWIESRPCIKLDYSKV